MPELTKGDKARLLARLAKLIRDVDAPGSQRDLGFDLQEVALHYQKRWGITDAHIEQEITRLA